MERIETAQQPSWMARTGGVLTILVALFLLMDAGFKLVAPQMAIDNSPPGLGWPPEIGVMHLLGVVLLLPTLLYLWPRTSILGAILVTGYLGGAIATHVRVGSPLFSHTLFGVYLGVLLWLGLWLRMPALRALIPFRSGAAS